MNKREFLKTTAILGAGTFVAPAMASSHLNPSTQKGATASLIAQNSEGKFVQPELGYAFDALEPHIDAKTMVDVLQHGAAGSWQMVNRTETAMNNEFDFGFAIDWMRKDLAICFDEAEKLGVELPLAKQVDEKYAELQERGYSRSDTSVLLKQFDDEKR